MKKYIGKGYIENSKFYYKGSVIKFENKEDFRSALMLCMAQITESITKILDPLYFIATNYNGSNKVLLIKNTQKIASEDFIEAFNEYLLSYSESNYRKIIGYLLFLSYKTEDKENDETLPLVNFLINISKSGLIDKEEQQIYLNDLIKWEELIKKDNIIKGINDYDPIYDKPNLKVNPDTFVVVEDLIGLQEALKHSESDTIININKNNPVISIQIKKTNKFISYQLKNGNLYENLINGIKTDLFILEDESLDCKYRINSLIEKDYIYICLRVIPNISNYKIEDLIYESKSC